MFRIRSSFLHLLRSPPARRALNKTCVKRSLTVSAPDVVTIKLEDGTEYVFNFNCYIEALENYKLVHSGSLSVPGSFIVPQRANWPLYLWGYPLGDITKDIVSSSNQTNLTDAQQKKLETIGFNVHRNPYCISLDDLSDLLDTYRRIYGNLDIPDNYVVPLGDDRWSHPLWGRKLGFIARNIRVATQMVADHKRGRDDAPRDSGGDPDDDPSMPSNPPTLGCRMGPFSVTSPVRFASTQEVVHDDVTTGGGTGGDVTGSGGSGETGGSEEGRHHPRGRKRSDSLSDRMLIRGLAKYKHLHNHFVIPYHFTIPENSEQWPKDLWGRKLGRALSEIAFGHRTVSEELKKDLDDLGISIDAHARNLATEMRILLHVKYGHAHNLPMTIDRPLPHVEASFVVPRDDTWPQAAWGFQLGDYLKCQDKMRVYNSQLFHMAERILAAAHDAHEASSAAVPPLVEQIMAPDVFPRPPRSTLPPHEERYRGDRLTHQEIIDLLTRYQEIHANLQVPETFVVPRDTADWPESLWGIELGRVVQMLRTRWTVLSEEDREELLQMGLEI